MANDSSRLSLLGLRSPEADLFEAEEDRREAARRTEEKKKEEEEEEVLTMDKAMRLRKEAQLRLKAWRVVWGKRQMQPAVGVEAWRKVVDKTAAVLDMDSASSEVSAMWNR